MKTLLINNFSPYIENIITILNENHNNFECYDCNKIVSFDDDHLELIAKFDNVILSGRQKNSAIINKVNSAIIKSSLVLDKPLLGICYGGQILALTLGCTLKRMDKIREIVDIEIIETTDLLPGYTSVKMFESHSYCVSKLASDFILLASSLSCKNEMFCVKKRPFFGTQFHPEKSGKPGKLLISNFLNIK